MSEWNKWLRKISWQSRLSRLHAEMESSCENDLHIIRLRMTTLQFVHGGYTRTIEAKPQKCWCGRVFRCITSLWKERVNTWAEYCHTNDCIRVLFKRNSILNSRWPFRQFPFNLADVALLFELTSLPMASGSITTPQKIAKWTFISLFLKRVDMCYENKSFEARAREEEGGEEQRGGMDH